jgi:hypothetical protein
MKTWKHGIFGIVAIIALAFAFFACDDKPDPETPQPQDWEAIINLSFANNATATVKGISLLPSEWNGIADKIATAINEARSNATGATPGRFNTVFMDSDAIIIVEKTTAYKCKVIDGVFRTLYFNLNYLNDPDLQTTITAAVNVMARETEGGYILE